MLKSIQSMWVRMILVAMLVNSSFFFMCGLYAMLKHTTGPKFMRSPRWAAAIILAPLMGVISAVVLGAVPSFLIAAVYVNVPAVMSDWQALGWGCFLGVLIALVNAGAFQRIV